MPNTQDQPQRQRPAAGRGPRGQSSRDGGGGRRRNQGCHHAQTCSDCKREISRLKHTIARRGGTIAGLYHALRLQLEERIEQEPERFVEVPIAPNNATQPDFAERLEQLAHRAEALGGPTQTFQLGSNFSCNVCFESYDDRQRMPLTMMCGHTICLSCMRRLQRTECPSCRERITAFTRLYV